MIIGIDASRANHKEKTGVEWYAFHVIEEMKKSRANSSEPIVRQVKVILYSDRPLEGELARLPENWESRVLRWPPRLRPPTESGDRAGQAWRLWTQARLSWEMLTNPPDVLFIPAHVFPIIHPKKTVMTVHDVAAARFPETYNRFERWYSLWSARFAARHLWKVIVPSEFTKSELIKTSLPQQRRPALTTGKHKNINTSDSIIVVPHGYSKISARPRPGGSALGEETGAVLKKYGIQKPFLLSIGRLEEKKNTKRIVEAFDMLRSRGRDFQLVLVGKPGYGYDNVRTAIQNSRWKEDIILPGWIPPEETQTILSAAEVFIFPSLYEGFGLPILEAFAAGAPVVAATGSSLKEVAGEAAIYADPFSIEDIFRAVETILNDLSFRDSLRQQGHSRVEKFSWEDAARATWDILLPRNG